MAQMTQSSLGECASADGQAEQAADLIECPDCGLLQSLPAPVSGHRRSCRRCGLTFGRNAAGIDAALALGVTSIILFLIASLWPLMAIDIGGRAQSVHLASGVAGLADHGLLPLSIFVFAISVLAPVGRVVTLGWILLLLRQARRSRHLPFALRLAQHLRPWAMLDVFLVGALISLTKLHDLARIDIGVGFWALGLLVISLAAFEMTIDQRTLWESFFPQRDNVASFVADPYCSCRTCGLVQEVAAFCARCRAEMHHRKPESIQRALALVVTGFVLYLPANLYPVLTVVSFGHSTSATIMGGVMELLDGSDWPLAVIVFTASVAVPLLKLVGLSWLLLSTKLNLHERLRGRTRLYRLIELVSRWSVVDIFVAALLTALVTLGNIATIEPGLGALAFGAVVFVTMLATESFDPRLMWDAAGANHV